MSFETFSSYFTLISLIITDIIISSQNYKENAFKNIQKLEVGILTIASIQYLITINMDHYRTQKWRYVDWILTTPLLLGTFYLLAKEKGYEESFLPVFIANILMIIFGYLAEYPELTGIDKWIWYILSTLMLVYILWTVNQWDTFLSDQGVNTKNLAYFFYFGWTLYGINFLTPDEELRQVNFNILDFINKVLYSYALTDVISKIQ
jgi:bacteriorhodopsin